ncbi:hypothetical protein BU25DRAFT_221445 [Macroventuria anomochaeta]|uniref:Uncharacterized protein n=1 Tax=Macroventuria anomochaeta TaxID=301207 RepID=A0ACB6SBS1_9PLEO|nr:uncharacterized protein BU25DRAFT_221445 [Macroventuria anomochaeta]KAF2630957.1 hypothetical protein BU25DRAFT_221445 [Macroventuria anomochaeta]
MFSRPSSLKVSCFLSLCCSSFPSALAAVVVFSSSFLLHRYLLLISPRQLCAGQSSISRPSLALVYFVRVFYVLIVRAHVMASKRLGEFFMRSAIKRYLPRTSRMMPIDAMLTRTSPGETLLQRFYVMSKRVECLGKV